jgi:hypothetical protein
MLFSISTMTTFVPSTPKPMGDPASGPVVNLVAANSTSPQPPVIFRDMCHTI